MLKRMQQASNAFYAAAIAIGNHPFIEFTGLMNEYIKICEDAHAMGIDFSNCNIHTGERLPVASYRQAYMQEKLECIFGCDVQVEPFPGNPADKESEASPTDSN